ncbi:MAG TPA: serpin family protein [Candidatus Limnocylindria bacterium]
MADVARDEAPAADAALAAEAINAFGADLYRELPTEGNVVFSPSSIALALAMARCGAAGTTANEMDAVLHDVASDPHGSWLNALDRELGARNETYEDLNGTQEIVLRIANAAFAQRGLAFKPAYLEALASRFGAGIQTVDYAGAAARAADAINAWVSAQTEGRITDLVDEGTIDPNTILTLVNAIYMKAPWLLPFDPAQTSDGAFTPSDGPTVQVPMMHADTKFDFADGMGWQAVDLRYAGNTMAMSVILPDDLRSFEATLDDRVLADVFARFEEAGVDLTLPRFGIETNVDLEDALSTMGMPTAFGGAADFSGITADAEAAISAVVHQANIDVDELGTEAAAATAAAMATSGPPRYVTMTVDRPFLFVIRDLPTGTILFMGRVTDPS